MAEPSPGPLKDRFTALDTRALVREIRSLSRARVDKVFDHPGPGWSIALRVPGEGRRDLVIVPGRFAALVGRTEATEGLSPMARELRRLLVGTRLDRATEPGGERYLEVEFVAAADASCLLAVELFGQGNLVVARGGKIVAALRSKTWAHRSVRVGAEYAPPPGRADPWQASAAEIQAALESSRTDRATTLAARLTFGGPVAEEILARTGLSGNSPATEDPERSAEAIHGCVREIVAEVGDRPRGHLYRRGELLVDVEPFPSRRLAGDPTIAEQAFDSFSEAALLYFRGLPAVASARPARSEPGGVAELLRQRAQQLAAVDALSNEADRKRSEAETILARFPEVERLVADAEADERDRTVEVTLDGRRLTILRGPPLRASAQALFEEARVLRAKLDGARTALAETDARLAEGRLPTPGSTPASPTEGGRRSTPRWFEKHRWFLTSERVLVIGGRDAASNDLLVRRYLKPDDRYVHADIHGAPSVIVKHPPPGSPPVGESTMLEACQWGVCFSKAWRAGLASASAFWVSADQVSKAGASGEFVPRGAWVIHGTKQILKDLPTELAIGTIELEGEERWTAAPPKAVEALGQVRFLITPGEERERGEREIALARELGLARSRLQGLLPAGGIEFRRA